MSLTTRERRLRWAGLLIAAGLLVQLATLSRLHPLAFVAFIAIACPLIGAGMVLVLVALLTPPGEDADGGSEKRGAS
jgi:hypothetical protein